jgi:hypothetical protein
MYGLRRMLKCWQCRNKVPRIFSSCFLRARLVKDTRYQSRAATGDDGSALQENPVVAVSHRQSAGILAAIHPACRTRSTVGSGMLRNISWRTRTSLCWEDHHDTDLASGQTRDYKFVVVRRLVAHSRHDQIRYLATLKLGASNNLLLNDDLSSSTRVDWHHLA